MTATVLFSCARNEVGLIQFQVKSKPQMTSIFIIELSMLFRRNTNFCRRTDSSLAKLTSASRTLSLLRSERTRPRLRLSTAQKNPDKSCALLRCRPEARRRARGPSARADKSRRLQTNPGDRVSPGIGPRLRRPFVRSGMPCREGKRSGKERILHKVWSSLTTGSPGPDRLSAIQLGLESAAARLY